MLLALLLHNDPFGGFSIPRIGINIDRPVTHISLELRAGVAKDASAELLACAVDLWTVFVQALGVGLL